MFVHLGADGQCINMQASRSGEEYSLTVVLEKNAYFFFIEGEEILAIFPIPCGDTKYALFPKVSVQKQGARVVFYNMNSRPKTTEFCAVILVKGAGEEEVPSIAKVYEEAFRKNIAAAAAAVAAAGADNTANGATSSAPNSGLTGRF